MYFMKYFHIKEYSLKTFDEISTQKYFIYFLILIYMEVTQSNFAEALKIIDKLLPKVPIATKRSNTSPLTLSSQVFGSRSLSAII